jgi:hypothetical protein
MWVVFIPTIDSIPDQDAVSQVRGLIVPVCSNGKDTHRKLCLKLAGVAKIDPSEKYSMGQSSCMLI